MIRMLVRVLMLGLAFAIATRVLGWWGVPLTAALWGVISGGDGALAAVAAALAWAALLARDAAFGPLGKLVSVLGGLFHAPPVLLIVVTLVFPAALAWSAAVVSGGGRSTRTSPRPAR
jgi:hypothetical protein